MSQQNKQIEIMKTSSYTYEFANGTFTITKGIVTKFEWHVTVKLNDGFIMLDRSVFLTKRFAKETTERLLTKHGLL